MEQPEAIRSRECKRLIVPFGCNSSQMKALRNAATENVLEKLEKYGLGGVVAALGCKENKQRFIEKQSGEPLAFSVLSDELREQYQERVETLQTELEDMLERQNLLAQQKAMIDQIILEKEHFEHYFEETYAYHKENTIQHQRDQMKDSILRKYAISCVRLKTNESCERARMIEHLRSIRA